MHSYAERERETEARPDRGSRSEAKPPARTATAGGLPPRLRTNLEAMSGFAMGDVRVHRNSPEPAKLGALAFARGLDIHLAPGEDRHLPHEAWHVVQQKQGRSATAAVKMKRPGGGQGEELEAEADEMGDRLSFGAGPEGAGRQSESPDEPPPVEQGETELLEFDDDDEESVENSSDLFAPDPDSPRRRRKKKKKELDCHYEPEGRHSAGGFSITLPVITKKPPKKPINVDLDVPFFQNSDQPRPLTPAAIRTLNRVVRILNANPRATAWVSGSTSLGRDEVTGLTLGGVPTNGPGSQLAAARSNALINLLVRMGASGGQLATGQPAFQSALIASVRITFAPFLLPRLKFGTKRVRIFKFIKKRSFYSKAQQRKNRALSKQHRKLSKNRRRH